MSALTPEHTTALAPGGEATQFTLAASPARRIKAFGLAGRLLVITLGGVLAALALLYITRLSANRENWLHDRLVAAETAAIVFGVNEPVPLSQELTDKVLDSIGARSVFVLLPNRQVSLSVSDPPRTVDYVFDDTDPSYLGGVGAALQTLFAPQGSTLRVSEIEPQSGAHVEIVINQTTLIRHLWDLSRNFLVLSAVVSTAVMLALWAALWRMVIHPVRRLTTSIIAFGDDPQDVRRIIKPTGRYDDIGSAEAALAAMQSSLAHELGQRKRLAELGMAVARINHDLRNMLAAAQLISDRLAGIRDPLAQRLGPQLVATLDRAIDFCQSTLAYGGGREQPPNPRRFDLRELVREIVETAEASGAHDIRYAIDIPPNFELLADRDHVRRIVENLSRNAVQALVSEREQCARPAAIRFAAIRTSAAEALIEISDSGPGFPDGKIDHIFEPFHRSTRNGGSGLGLAIAKDLVNRNGGSIRLAPAEPIDFYCGARFLITLPTP